jgi:hypothetical protein
VVRLADVARRHGPAYLAQYRGAMLPSHVRALSAITYCRTPALGGHLGVCAQCGRRHLLYHSCRHRACPRCGHDVTERWLTRQRQQLLPVPYFHVVLTLPSELRRLVRSHQKALVNVLFRTAYEALAELCADERHLGGQIGALAVLHTWSRTLSYHPHVHLLVPGGALGSDGTWRPARSGAGQPYLVPERALAKLFAGKFLAKARRALPPDVSIPTIAAGTRWIANVKPVVSGADAVLRYLGRYVHRTAIADGALLSCDDETVTFRYCDSRTHERKTMTLPGHEFLRRVLQHVLPQGLHRVRAYGLLHSRHRATLCQLQLLLAGGTDSAEPEPDDTSLRLRCPHCRQGELILIDHLSAEQCFAMLEVLAITMSTARGPPQPLQPGASSP